MLNLTPHAITVETYNGRITFEPAGIIARVDTHTEFVGTVDDIPVVERSYGEVENVLELPCDPFLVSSMVLDMLPKEYSGVAFDHDLGDDDTVINFLNFLSNYFIEGTKAVRKS